MSAPAKVHKLLRDDQLDKEYIACRATLINESRKPLDKNLTREWKRVTCQTCKNLKKQYYFDGNEKGNPQ